MIIDLIVSLGRFGIPALDARAIAVEVRNAELGEVRVDQWLAIRYDGDAHRADLARRLRDAAERVVPRRRGRPPERLGRK